MDSVYFYWFSWMGWIIVTFLVSKSNQRFWISASLLLLIYLTTIHLRFENQSMNASLLFLALISYAYIGYQSFRSIVYSIFVSTVIAFGYVSMHFLMMFDPIWIFFSRLYFISIPLSIMVLFFIRPLNLRIPTLISGLVHGEIAYATYFQHLSPGYVIGSGQFLDVVGVSCMMVMLWWSYEWLINSLKQWIDRPGNHLKGRTP